MKKSVLNKLLVRGGATVAGLAVLGAVMMVYITTYGEPEYNPKKINELRNFARPDAEEAYRIARKNAIKNGRTSAERTAQYKQLSQKIEKLEQVYDHSDVALQSAYEQRDSVESEFINHALNTDQDFIAAEKRLKNIYGKIEKLRQDSADAAEIQKLPLKVRFNNNYQTLREDVNKLLIKYHQHRLNKLRADLKETQNER